MSGKRGSIGGVPVRHHRPGINYGEDGVYYVDVDQTVLPARTAHVLIENPTGSGAQLEVFLPSVGSVEENSFLFLYGIRDVNNAAETILVSQAPGDPANSIRPISGNSFQLIGNVLLRKQGDYWYIVCVLDVGNLPSPTAFPGPAEGGFWRTSWANAGVPPGSPQGVANNVLQFTALDILGDPGGPITGYADAFPFIENMQAAQLPNANAVILPQGGGLYDIDCNVTVGLASEAPQSWIRMCLGVDGAYSPNGGVGIFFDMTAVPAEIAYPRTEMSFNGARLLGPGQVITLGFQSQFPDETILVYDVQLRLSRRFAI
jgi:hypothetical protein